MAFIVATEVLLLLHTPGAIDEVSDKTEVEPAHNVVLPVIVPAVWTGSETNMCIESDELPHVLPAVKTV